MRGATRIRVILEVREKKERTTFRLACCSVLHSRRPHFGVGEQCQGHAYSKDAKKRCRSERWRYAVHGFDASNHPKRFAYAFVLRRLYASRKTRACLSHWILPDPRRKDVHLLRQAHTPSQHRTSVSLRRSRYSRVRSSQPSLVLLLLQRARPEIPSGATDKERHADLRAS